MITYGRIIQMLSDAGWSSYRIRKEQALPESTMTRLRNNLPLSTTTIEILCRLCNCQPGDFLTYIPDKEQE